MSVRLIKRRVILPVILSATAGWLALSSYRPYLAQQSTRVATTPVAPASKANTEIPTTPAELALAREIDRAIDGSDLVQARWGVFVASLGDGRMIYSRSSDKLFTPASNMKIYTTAVALDLLGSDYRWRTSVYAAKQPDGDGMIDGDVTLYGRGAPDLVSFKKNGATSLAQLADDLYQRGVRRVRGNIVGDESYFRGNPYGDGWQWNDLQWYFGAEPSALTVDGNAVELTITPGTRASTPAALALNRKTEFVNLSNNTSTVDRGSATTIGINRGLSNNDLRVWGEFPAGARGLTAYVSVHNPSLWAASLFKEALAARGIKVDGEASSRDFRVRADQKFDPARSVELAIGESAPLGEIARATNKESINLNAELILRTLGKERGSTAPDSDPRKMKQRGDDQAGAAVIKLWLERAGVSTAGIAIRDGSGLSRLDLVSPEVTARLLISMTKSNSFSVFKDSLPIAGRDGTLKPRLRTEAGRIVAKTGTLTYDHSLSGYVTTRDNEVFAFSIFCNDATGHTDPVKVIDEIAGLLAEFRHS
jgi:serine-type D-Ala-D-Ala carboxypeptidase/endopeptidase (penicillin-binding protein 4)